MFTAEEISDAIANPKLVVKKGLFPNTPSWEAFVQQLNFEFYNENRLPLGPDDPYNPEDTIIHGVNIREHFYLMIDSELESPFFPEQYQIIDKLNSLMSKEAFNTFTLINFVGGERPINIHNDPRHSFYWQCQGKSIWKSYDFDAETPILLETIEVNPGDIIFVPNGIFHTVETPEPRTAMSFMYELN